MVKKRGNTAVAKAVAAAMRRRDRREWTIVEYGGADWTHGYCTGDRSAAWRACARKLARVKPPAFLDVPYAQFCVDGGKVLVESAVAHGSGQGEIFNAVKVKGVMSLVATKDGVKWRIGS